jgi:hypothetical protein
MTIRAGVRLMRLPACSGIGRACVLLTIVLCGCRSASAPREPLPPGLIVLPEARDVRTAVRNDGRVELTYTATQAYPADAVLERLSAAMPRPEWEPLANDWLNPDVSSSHRRGWSDYVDGRRGNQRVHQWLGQWRDSHGNLVLYDLQYVSRPHLSGSLAPDNPNLRVSAMWVPQPLADRMKEWASGHPAGHER